MDKPKYRNRKKPGSYQAGDGIFEPVKVYLPKGTITLLRQKAYELNQPLSRLCAIAIDNELDQESAFAYPCDVPINPPYIEYEYVDEAGKLLRFLEGLPRGTTVDSLMLCRRDYGIPLRSTVMLAYRELLAKQMIKITEEQYKKHRYPHVEAVHNTGDVRKARIEGSL